MQVSVTARHGSISDDVREHITHKSEKLLTFFERVIAIEVTVDFLKDRVRVDLLVDTEHRHNFVARDEGEEIFSTFERVFQKMEQQVRRYKEKLQDHRRDLPLNEISQTPQGPEESAEADSRAGEISGEI